MFNRYRGDGEYGFHIDKAIRVAPASGERIRTDISTCSLMMKARPVNAVSGTRKIRPT
jgi:predicted 2-oxoglutarate/Fe(II)-dependent dioxygenase YbiX